MRWNRLRRATRIAPWGVTPQAARGGLNSAPGRPKLNSHPLGGQRPEQRRSVGASYLPLTYSATAAISSSVIFSATTCITALSLVRSRLLKDLSWVWM